MDRNVVIELWLLEMGFAQSKHCLDCWLYLKQFTSPAIAGAKRGAWTGIQEILSKLQSQIKLMPIFRSVYVIFRGTIVSSKQV